MTTSEQLAHDLAMVYLVNRYSAGVVKDLNGDSSPFDDGAGTGRGRIDTERLPDVDAQKTTRVGTGEHGRFLFWRFEKRLEVETGEYHVDPIFQLMINDYRKAHARFLQLLTGDEKD